jgi:hypothetical protein
MRKKRKAGASHLLGSITGGINSTTKSQLKKIQNTILDTTLPPVTYGDLYMYVKNQWTHKGKCCMLCSKVMNDPIVLENHRYVCAVNIQKHKHTGTD